MKIGIDIDNTITHTRELILDYARKYSEENKIKIANGTGYRVEEACGWSEQTSSNFLDKYLMNIYENVLPKEDAIEVIKELHKDNTIILITSRNERNTMVKETTLKWLTENQVEYDKLLMNNTENMHHFSKLSTCIENEIALMIEDHPELSQEISKEIPVLMFDYPYNRYVDDQNIIRVKKWMEIKNIISNRRFKSVI